MTTETITTEPDYVGVLFWYAGPRDMADKSPMQCRYGCVTARVRETHWNTLANLWEQAAAANRTSAREVLAYRPAREAVADAIELGKAFTAQAERHGKRKLIVEARLILLQRQIRRNDRRIADNARNVPPGRVVRALAGRIELRRRNKLSRTRDLIAAVSCFRTARGKWAGGDHFTEVDFIGTHGTLTARGCSTTAWSSNGKWRGKNSNHKFTVPENWIDTVHAAGITWVDNFLTLCAAVVTDPKELKGSEAAWRVTVAKQSTGFDLKIETGFIVMFAGKIHFGKTIKAAKRKCAAEWKPLFSGASR